MWVTVRRWRSIAAAIGAGGPPASMRTALPPGRSPTTYELESQPGSMLRSRITPGAYPLARARDRRLQGSPGSADSEGMATRETSRLHGPALPFPRLRALLVAEALPILVACLMAGVLTYLLPGTLVQDG